MDIDYDAPLPFRPVTIEPKPPFRMRQRASWVEDLMKGLDITGLRNIAKQMLDRVQPTEPEEEGTHE